MWICFQTPLSQDDELALMAGYAAAMDASMSEGSSTQDVTTAIASGPSSPPDTLEPQEGPSGIGRPPEDWESQTGEDLDHTSLSMCVSEVNCKKSRGERTPGSRAAHPDPVTSKCFALCRRCRATLWIFLLNPLPVVISVFLSLCLVNFSFPTVVTAISDESSDKLTLCPEE